jgi:hypothetical protein
LDLPATILARQPKGLLARRLFDYLELRGHGGGAGIDPNRRQYPAYNYDPYGVRRAFTHSVYVDAMHWSSGFIHEQDPIMQLIDAHDNRK